MEFERHQGELARQMVRLEESVAAKDGTVRRVEHDRVALGALYT